MVLEKEPEQPSHFIFIACCKKKSPVKVGRNWAEGKCHIVPLQKKGAQSLRKGTTALVSKLRLRETHFDTTYHQRGSILEFSAHESGK